MPCAVSVFLSNIPPWPLAAQLRPGPYLAGDPNSRGVGGRRPSSVSCECIKYTLVGKAGAHLYSATISVTGISINKILTSSLAPVPLYKWPKCVTVRKTYSGPTFLYFLGNFL